MNDLTDFLLSRGYVRIPLTRSGVGHFHTSGTLNGRPVVVLVDTGASTTVMALSVIQEIDLKVEWIDSGAAGAGGSFDQFKIYGADLRLGSFVPRLAVPVGFDFEQVNGALRAQGSTEVDVILGVDVFDAHAAVIDYTTRSLFLMQIEAETDREEK